MIIDNENKKLPRYRKRRNERKKIDDKLKFSINKIKSQKKEK